MIYYVNVPFGTIFCLKKYITSQLVHDILCKCSFSNDILVKKVYHFAIYGS